MGLHVLRADPVGGEHRHLSQLLSSIQSWKIRQINPLSSVFILEAAAHRRLSLVLVLGVSWPGLSPAASA